MRRTALLTFMVLLAALPARASHEIGHTSVFTRIDAPGMPEGLLVQDGTVFVGTHTSVRGNAGGPPSRIFAYHHLAAELISTIEVSGQNTSATHGILAIAADAAGRLYVLDRNPSRMIRIDIGTGEQITYATFPELQACRPGTEPPPVGCAPVTVDEPNFPDYFVFDAEGYAYVTDLQAATIWRVPPGGGAPEIWFQDARLDGIFGPNGIAIGPDGLIYFAMTGSQQPDTLGLGIIYTLPRVADPRPEDLKVFHVFPEPAAGPDGISFGASGRLYVALAGSNQVSILERDGTEAARFPDIVANQQQQIPYDLPASIAFDGRGNILVTNQSFFAADPEHWAVLRAWVNDVGQPLIRPAL